MASPRPAGALPAEYAELHPDSWTGPYWAGARRHELLVPQCVHCGTFRMPPGPFCHRCRKQEVKWVPLAGGGTIFTYTHVRHAVVPGLRPFVPYTVAVIDLDGAPGARLIADIVNTDEDRVAIGARATVVWDDIDDDVTIPRFEVTDS